jgi:hypothetical protein
MKMDELNPVLPPNLQAALDEFYAAPQPDPAFAAHLGAQLRRHQSELLSTGRKSRPSSSGTRKSLMRTLRARPFLALLAVLLALLALTGMAYALGRLAGFIPGFGFTSQGSTTYVLAEPVEGTSGTISLRVNQAVNDGERFWVELSATGLAGWEGFPQAFLLLPEGERIGFQSGGSSGSGEESTKLSILFPKVRGSIPELTLLIEGLNGQDFNLPLRLRPLEADEIALVPPEGSAPLQSEPRDGVQMVLDHVAVDSSKTVFQVSLQFDRPDTWLAGPWNVTLSDEAGNLYPLTDVTPDTMTTGDTHIYQTAPFSGVEQLTLTLVSFPATDTLTLFEDFYRDSPAFTFDPGSSPEIGQRWELDQALSASGFDLKVVSATLTGETGLVFDVETDPPVTGVMFQSPDPLVTASSGGITSPGGNVSSDIMLSRIPTGPFEVQLMRVYYQAKGPWLIRWQPPAAPTASAAATLAPTTKPAPSPAATPALSAPGDPLLLEVQQLAQKFEAPFQQGPGWVHVARETFTNPEAGQDYPPPYLKTEQWYEIDEEGFVTRSVWLDYDDAGQLIQQSATVGDYSVNFTFAFSGFNEGPRYRITLVGLVVEVSRAIEHGLNVSREEVNCEDGSPCLLISTWETFAEPVQNPGELQAFSGAGQRGWIYLESGMQVKEQSFWKLAGGGEQIESTSSTVLVVRLDSPPQEILDILDRVIVP